MAHLLAAATADGRAVLTHDRDYIRLHKAGTPHGGIVFTTDDRDFPALATRIHATIVALSTLVGQLVRKRCGWSSSLVHITC